MWVLIILPERFQASGSARVQKKIRGGGQLKSPSQVQLSTVFSAASKMQGNVQPTKPAGDAINVSDKLEGDDELD